jgi:hypothetical protein
VIGTTVSHDKIPAKLGGNSMGLTCHAPEIHRDGLVPLNVVNKPSVLRLLEKEYPHE